jgi:hypothetical protein
VDFEEKGYYFEKMSRKPKPNAAEYLRRVLNIPITRPMTGHEIQRLDFSKAVLEFIIKKQPSKKRTKECEGMGEFINNYAQANGILPKVCYTVLKILKDRTIVHLDEAYTYNRHRYHRDLTALKAFHEQVKVWRSNTNEDPRNHLLH